MLPASNNVLASNQSRKETSGYGGFGAAGQYLGETTTGPRRGTAQSPQNQRQPPMKHDSGNSGHHSPTVPGVAKSGVGPARDSNGASPNSAHASDTEKLNALPCIHLKQKGAKLKKLYIITDVQCAIVATAGAVRVEGCTMEGGGVVVRTDPEVSRAEAEVVVFEGNKVRGLFGIG